MAIEKIARDKIQKLCNLDVSSGDHPLLGEYLVYFKARTTVASGFTYTTCFDLNRGYYYFKLDKFAQCLCVIILPWGHYQYKRLPQGLK
eukprot:8757912-Ditylum_brightwellii.AAC.1